MRVSRQAAGRRAAIRWAAVVVAAVATSAGMALALQGAAAPAGDTVVVQPGDTLWSIASVRFPSDDVRARVDQIEQINGLGSPVIVTGESLRLPAA